MAYRRTPQIQARLDLRRAAMVSTTIELITESGYAGCSIAAVAGRAGVAAGTVYRDFESKTDLFAEVFRQVVGRELAAVRAAVDQAGDGPPAVVALIDTFAGRALKAPRLAYALLAEPVDPEIDALRLELRRSFRRVLADVIAGGIRNGTLPEQDAAAAASAIVGAIAESLVGPLRDELTHPDPVGALRRFALRGLGVSDDPHA